MKLAVPTLSAQVLDSAPTDSRSGLLPMPASNQSSQSGSVLDLPLFIDVLAQVLPSSVISTETVARQQDAPVPPESLQDMTVGPEPSPDSVLTEGTDLGALPAAWEQSAWGSVVGAVAVIAADAVQGARKSTVTVARQQDVQMHPESFQHMTVARPEPSPDSVLTEGTDLGALPAAWGQSVWGGVAGAAAVIAADAVQGTRKSMPDEEARLPDPAAAGVASAPVMTLPIMSLPIEPLAGFELNRGLPAPSSQETVGTISTISTISTVGRGASLLVSADLLASMAQPLAHPPAADGSTTAALGEQAPMSLVSDRAAALIQSTAALPQTGDSAPPLALNPRQPDLWQRPLAQALGERLQVQGAQGEEQALIRLDPPSLGRVEILLRQEGGTWQVQLSATHPEVSRQLQAISETLRHELSVRQQASVTVQVTSDHLGHADGRQQRQRQDGQQPREPGRAWDGEEATQTFDLA